MDKNYLIQLTNNLYRLTLLFPKKEPLRYKMRELADDILADLISTNLPQNVGKNFAYARKLQRNSFLQGGQILENLEVLDSFFEVAKNQNWVSSSQILEIQKEYRKIKEDYYPPTTLHPKPTHPKEEVLTLQPKSGCPKKEASITLTPPPVVIGPKKEKVSLERNSRQEKILAILKEKGRAQVWEIKRIFPEVTKRTLRRDFEFLLKQGKIERIGRRNKTFYQIKDRTYLH